MATINPVDPTLYQIFKYGFTAAFGLISALLIKIVYDWLTGKSSRKNDKEFCAMHKHFEKEIEILRTRHVDRDDFKDLAKKVTDFQVEIREEMSQIKSHIAVLTERIGQHD